MRARLATSAVVVGVAVVASAAGLLAGAAGRGWGHPGTWLVAALGAVVIGAVAGGQLLLRRWYAHPFEQLAALLQQPAAASPRRISPAAAVRLAGAQRERLAALQAAAARTQAMLDDIEHGVLVFDVAGDLAASNRAGRRLLGLDGGGAGHYSTLLTEAALQEAVAATLRRGTHGDIDLQDDAAPGRRLMASSRPLAAAAAVPSGALVVLRDVTRLRQLEQIRRDFVANVSHQLRTPITSINGFVETLIDNRMYVGAEARRFLGIIQRQAQRLTAIVEDLLTLSNLELGAERHTIGFEPTLLAPLIASAVHACQTAAAARAIELGVDCAPSLACRVNAQLIEQALVNLLDNAIRYSPRGGKVAVVARPAGERVELTVRDAGPGIDAEHLPRIFERFYRAERGGSGEDAGTGLGLAIVRHIVSAHAGEVSVRSEPGQGSAFSLRLPA